MKIKETPISNLFILEKPVRKDERGQFCRLYGKDELENLGIKSKAIHVNSSTSNFAGTIRGIHFQYPPYAECKIISCISGSIWDVAVDLRPNSKTRFHWFGTILTPENGKSLIIPEYFGHAFISLEDKASVIYVSSEIYSPEHESGIRYDDPTINIKWPIKPKIVSQKDKSWDLLENQGKEFLKPFMNINKN